jgi:hypothetical protein
MGAWYQIHIRIANLNIMRNTNNDKIGGIICSFSTGKRKKYLITIHRAHIKEYLLRCERLCYHCEPIGVVAVNLPPTLTNHSQDFIHY